MLVVWLASAAPAVPDCGLLSVASTAVDFYSYRPTDGMPVDAVGMIEVHCAGVGEGSTSYTIGLGPSEGERERTLSDGEHRLEYELFRDPARTLVWSADDGVGTISGEIEANDQQSTTHEIYGRIFASQNVPPGIYSDRITVTIFF